MCWKEGGGREGRKTEGRNTLGSMLEDKRDSSLIEECLYLMNMTSGVLREASKSFEEEEAEDIEVFGGNGGMRMRAKGDPK